MSFSHTRLGPGTTPKALKYLVWTTLFISLFAATTHHIIPYYLGWISPEQLLSLSVWGIDHFYIWQFITYLFIQPIPNGLSFSFLLSLAFNAYILWIIGSSLIEKKGLRHFFILYLLGGIFNGALIYALQLVTHNFAPFAGNSPALYSLLMAWLALFPGAEFLLFMIVPIRASWLILGFLGINVLIDLSTGNLIRVFACIASASLGYAYGSMLLNKSSPSPTYTRAKKFDFKTGKAILTDDEFLNEMLTKIQLKGRSSLTWKERLRLYKISRKKRQP